MTSFEALVHLAEERRTSIAHLPDPWTGADVYFVDDGRYRYRYRASGRPTDRRPVAI